MNQPGTLMPTHTQTSAPLYTFGRAAWERRLLPAAQYLPFPTERFTGTLTLATASGTFTTPRVGRHYAVTGTHAMGMAPRRPRRG